MASEAGATADAAGKADELALMTRFATIAMLFTSTVAVISLAAFAVCIFPQREAAKWLSRSIWIGWLVSWAIGVFGLAVYVASDTFVTEFCSDADCERGQRSLRTWLIAGVFVTLALAFYFGIVLSAYVHTLHPHLFMSPDSDTEDEYSDPDEGFERKLEGHLISLGEPYLSEYLAERKRQTGTSDADSLVSRRASSRRRRNHATEDSDSDATQRGSNPDRRKLPLDPRSDQWSSDASSSGSERDAMPLRPTRA